MKYCCDLCIQSFTRELNYINHSKNGTCKTIINDALIELPREDLNYIEFKNMKNAIIQLFSGYYDMVSMLVKVDGNDNNDIIIIKININDINYQDKTKKIINNSIKNYFKNKNKKTKTIQERVVTKIGFTFVSRYPEIENNYYIKFEGKDVVINFIKHIIDLNEEL